MVYKEIKHLTMLKDVKQVVQIHEVFEMVDTKDEVHIVMEARRLLACPANLSSSVS